LISTTENSGRMVFLLTVVQGWFGNDCTWEQGI